MVSNHQFDFHKFKVFARELKDIIHLFVLDCIVIDRKGFRVY